MGSCGGVSARFLRGGETHHGVRDVVPLALMPWALARKSQALMYAHSRWMLAAPLRGVRSLQLAQADRLIVDEPRMLGAALTQPLRATLAYRATDLYAAMRGDQSHYRCRAHPVPPRGGARRHLGADRRAPARNFGAASARDRQWRGLRALRHAADSGGAPGDLAGTACQPGYLRGSFRRSLLRGIDARGGTGSAGAHLRTRGSGRGADRRGAVDA